jgi:hypothetical protein
MPADPESGWPKQVEVIQLELVGGSRVAAAEDPRPKLRALSSPVVGCGTRSDAGANTCNCSRVFEVSSLAFALMKFAAGCVGRKVSGGDREWGERGVVFRIGEEMAWNLRVKRDEGVGARNAVNGRMPETGDMASCPMAV